MKKELSLVVNANYPTDRITGTLASSMSCEKAVHEGIGCFQISLVRNRKLVRLMWLRLIFFSKILSLLVMFALIAKPLTAFCQPGTPIIKLNVGEYQIEAEVASTLDTRDIGLMYRKNLPDNHGMIFVFPESHRHCMWMKDTHIPLSAAFINDEGIIVNINEMMPGTEDFYCAEKAVVYVLEMNGDWFNQRGIGSGARIEGIEKVPAGR